MTIQAKPTTKKFQHTYGMVKGHSPMAKNVVCVDFDATIFPWGPLINYEAEPLPGAVEAMKAIKASGKQIAIFTSRMSDRWLAYSGNSKEEQYNYVAAMCDAWDIPWDEITGEKIPTIAYIDDKAIEFTGDNWKEIQERVVNL